MTLLEIIDQPDVRGLPVQQLAGQGTRGWNIASQEVRHQTEVLNCLLPRDRNDWKVEVATNHLRDGTERHALLGDPMQATSTNWVGSQTSGWMTNT